MCPPAPCYSKVEHRTSENGVLQISGFVSGNILPLSRLIRSTTLHARSVSGSYPFTSKATGVLFVEPSCLDPAAVRKASASLSAAQLIEKNVEVIINHNS